MPYIRTFEGYAPPARHDDLPFTSVLIREAATADGVYTTLETITLSPVDADPAAPASRDFTTALATLENGWYVIRWRDAALAVYDSDPVHYSDNTATLPPTAATIKEWSQVDFDDIGFESDVKFERVVEGANLWLPQVVGRNWSELDPDTTDETEKWINWAMCQAVMMQVEYKCFVAQQDIAEGWSDFNLIQSFTSSDYSENRRSPNSRTRGIHPWTDLADLLLDLMTPELAASYTGDGPGYAVVEPSWDVGREIIDAKKDLATGPFGPYRPPWDQL